MPPPVLERDVSHFPIGKDGLAHMISEWSAQSTAADMGIIIVLRESALTEPRAKPVNRCKPLALSEGCASIRGVLRPRLQLPVKSRTSALGRNSHRHQEEQ